MRTRTTTNPWPLVLICAAPILGVLAAPPVTLVFDLQGLFVLLWVLAPIGVAGLAIGVIGIFVASMRRAGGGFVLSLLAAVLNGGLLWLIWIALHARC